MSKRVTLRFTPDVRADDRMLLEIISGLSARQANAEILNYVRDGVKHQKVLVPLVEGLRQGSLLRLDAGAFPDESRDEVRELAALDLADMFEPPPP
ncbi:MAG: hypothetical protein AB7L71_02500 [Vicinamibacterales bacterium]